MSEDRQFEQLPARTESPSRQLPSVMRTGNGQSAVALPSTRQLILHLTVAFRLGGSVTAMILWRHQVEREEIAVIQPLPVQVAAPVAPTIVEAALSMPPPPEPEPEPVTVIDDAVSPQIEIIAPELVYKEKDKLLLVHKNDRVVERYINFTPDVIDAAIRCNTTRVRELLTQGADVNSSDERGDTVLAWAVKRKCAPVVRLLLERGAHINTISRNGFTPYVWSRIYGHQEMSEMLKVAGADTESGSYWWRNEEDGNAAWMKARYDALCKNQLCN